MGSGMTVGERNDGWGPHCWLGGRAVMVARWGNVESGRPRLDFGWRRNDGWGWSPATTTGFRLAPE